MTSRSTLANREKFRCWNTCTWWHFFEALCYLAQVRHMILWDTCIFLEQLLEIKQDVLGH